MIVHDDPHLPKTTYVSSTNFFSAVKSLLVKLYWSSSSTNVASTTVNRPHKSIRVSSLENPAKLGNPACFDDPIQLLEDVVIMWIFPSLRDTWSSLFFISWQNSLWLVNNNAISSTCRTRPANEIICMVGKFSLVCMPCIRRLINSLAGLTDSNWKTDIFRHECRPRFQIVKPSCLWISCGYHAHLQIV